MGEVMDLIIDIENELGWQPSGQGALYKRRTAAVGRMNRLIEASHPKVTVADLRLALTYLSKKRHTIKQPTELFRYVAEAKQRSQVTLVTDVEVAIAEAIECERQHPSPDSEKWISRFFRATGPYRREVLNEWRARRNA